MKSATLIFPDQLFENHPSLAPDRPIFLVEEFLLFKVQAFHKQRLVLLRASMKAYAQFLENKGHQVHYIESSYLQKRGELLPLLAKKGVKEIHLADITDDWLQQDLDNGAKEHAIKLEYCPSPMFICSLEEIYDYFQGKNKFLMAQFYAYQRKKHHILMDGESPIGGKMSFDKDNRKRLPKGIKIPSIYIPKHNAFVEEAQTYIEKYFPETIGNADPFYFPTSFAEAKKALSSFIEQRLSLFGDYEDAISHDESFLFHSVLTPSLNIGLLTPAQVISTTLAYTRAHKIPLNSLEGFLRQVMGWREFMRASYILLGRKMRSTNYFNHTASLPKGFWNGTTGILPIDKTIQKILKTGYCHHIERLMVLGNFLLLTECNPDFVYEWFMGYFVDAYDWVMVPNVYAMSQYADKGMITTKPYISGANYILKMSNYPKGEWVEIWDGLFWRFLSKHKKLFEQNPRTKVLFGHLEKDQGAIQSKVKAAEQWLSDCR